MLYFLYQINHFLDEINDIFKGPISDKSSFVQEKKTVRFVVFENREEFDAESTS